MISLAGAPELRTERLLLRPQMAADFEVYAAYYTSDRGQMTGGSNDRYAAWKSFGHFTGHWVLRGYSMFTLVEIATGRAIGQAGPWAPESWPEPEIGWMLWDASREGLGFAREAAEATRRWAYAALGWNTCVSYIKPGNDRSIRLAERMGAWLEPDPVLFSGKPYHVYRHPGPEVLA